MKRRRRKGRRSHQKPKALDQSILDILSKAGQPLAAKNIARKLEFLAPRKIVLQRIEALSGKGKIIETANGGLKLARSKKDRVLVSGRVDLTRSGNAYVRVEGMENDVFVRSSRLNRAFDGDEVRVALRRKKKSGHWEGEVTEIISRAKDAYVGNLYLHDDYAIVVPLKNGAQDIFVPLNKIKKELNASDGDRVVVRIVDWPARAVNPIGEITAVLGEPGENDTEMNSILIQSGFPIGFSDEVLDLCNSFSEDFSEEELKMRRDMRDHLTFTIDPADAKDFDDALSWKKIGEDRWELGIHIADVSYFVEPGNVLDEEAKKRTTSVYLVDRVNPMLPERLSNELCSLRPNEDKRSFSAVFEIDSHGKIYSEWFGRTMIHSNHRFAYEEAQQVILGRADPTISEELTQAVLQLNLLAGKLREHRFNRGSVRFETPELRIVLDESRKAVGVQKRERLDAHMLIEDFMLLANRRVCEFIGKAEQKDNPPVAVFRIHDEPDREKLQNLEFLLEEFGYEFRLPDRSEDIPAALNRLMEELDGKPEQGILSMMAVRAMAKAVYSTDNIGHFGLGFDYYTHFTSPIRRYADVLVHRMVQEKLDGKQKYDQKSQIESICKHASVMERKAMDAEFDSRRFKQAEYLQEFVGQEFDGMISGITHFGIFVELQENYCEGMIPLQKVGSEFVYNDRLATLYSAERDKYYRLGDDIRVRIESVDLSKRQVDLDLIEPESE
jgi:ribonuclease R